MVTEKRTLDSTCHWTHLGNQPHFACHIDGTTVCARCCVERCRNEAPDAFAECQAADHPTWPKRPSVPRKLVVIEGYWDDARVFDRASVGPFLQGLAGIVPGLQIAHRRVNGRVDFNRLVTRTLWKDEQAHDVPVYYLAFHGTRGRLGIGNGLDIDALCTAFDGYGEQDHMLYFSSCSTFGGRWGDTYGRRLREAAGSKAVIGYGADVDWADSMLIDLHVLQRFFTADEPWAALADIESGVREKLSLANDLKWKMFTEDDTQ